MGRAYKQTPELVAVIVSALEQGCTRRAAANIAGITERTLYLWLEADGQEGSFFTQVEAAEAEFERRVLEGAIKHPPTALKLLERRQRKDWYPPTEKLQVELIPNLEVVWPADAPDSPDTEGPPATGEDPSQPG